MRIEKRLLDGSLSYAWHGQVLAEGEACVVIEAAFDRYDRLALGYVTFERGDRFIETFYSDRYYSVFAIHGGDTLKGWYCNINRPATIADDVIVTVDLALDLWVWPDGRDLLLDEDEFAELAINDDERAECWAAIAELRALAAEKAGPFALA